jgi:hypothetical protein
MSEQATSATCVHGPVEALPLESAVRGFGEVAAVTLQYPDTDATEPLLASHANRRGLRHSADPLTSFERQLAVARVS